MSAPVTDTAPGLLVQVYGLLGGMTAYAIHLMAGSALVPLSCELSSTWPNHLLTLAALLAIAGSALAAWKTTKVATGGTTDDVLDRRFSFLGPVGLLLNGVAFLVVLYAEIPLWFFDPCLP